MSESKASPGPWSVGVDIPAGSKERPGVGVPILDANGRIVALTAYFDLKDRDATYADAKRIAAVPDLLDVCKEVLASFESTIAGCQAASQEDGDVVTCESCSIQDSCPEGFLASKLRKVIKAATKDLQ